MTPTRMARQKQSAEALQRKVREALAGHPLLAGVPPELIDRIVREGSIEVFEAGQMLSREGEPADYWFLTSGSTRVYYSSPSGFQVTVKIFRAPAAWAEMEVLTDHPHIEDCVAVDRATVVRLPRPLFERLLMGCPSFMRNVLYDTCARFLISAQHERALAFMKVPERLAYLLLAYVRIYGVPAEGGIAIRVPLSQTGLARGLGVTTRSVERALAQLKDQKILTKAGGRYVVRDVEQLARLTGEDVVGVDWIAGRKVSEGKGWRSRG